MIAKTLHRIDCLVVGAIVCIVLLYGFVLVPNGYFEKPRLKTQDMFFRAAHTLQKLPQEINQIAVVVIDDESLAMINEKWPWDRARYAYVLDQISKAHPQAIAFDIVFLGRSVDAASDEKFAQSLQAAGNVLLASYQSENGAYAKPYEMFARAAAGFGLINKPRDADGLVRASRLWMRQEGGNSILDYTLEVKTLCKYFQVDTQSLSVAPDHAVFSRPTPLRIPLRGDESFVIDYIAQTSDFVCVPIWKVISGQVDPRDFEGKIVLVGQTNEIIHDVHPTPLGEMPGVIISANVLLTILSAKFIHEIAPFVSGLQLLLFCLLTLLIAIRWSFWKGLLAMLLLLGVYGALVFFLFQRLYVGDFFSVPVFMPAIFIVIHLHRSVRLFIENLALKHEAITDGLTGLYVHKYMLIRLQNELDRALRYSYPLSVAFLDIDWFKQFNDTHGHEAGNQALVHFTAILRDSFRKVDLLFRYGGEEFCVVLPGSDAANAFESLERFRKKLESTPVPLSVSTAELHASIGIVCVPDVVVGDIHALLEKADKALYQAKNTGRNRTCLYVEEGNVR